MTHRTPAHDHQTHRRAAAAAVQAEQARAERRLRRRSPGLWGLVALLVVGIVAAGLYTSRPTQQAAAEPTPAPEFTLPDTAGDTVDLAALRGRNVILYFSEGAGCQSCLVQMAQIEAQQAAFDAANITVLPIVMNTRDQITADMAANNVRTPFLLDDGTVSTQYGTIGRGMHAGLPGHSFVLIDAQGMRRWYGEYPSMWLDPSQLLDIAKTQLSAEA